MTMQTQSDRTQQKVTNLLSMAARARRIASGAFAVEEAAKRGQARFLLIAEDAEPSSKEKYEQLSNQYDIPAAAFLTKDTLGACLGRAGMTDTGGGSMSKYRVFELAKEFQLDPKVALSVLKQHHFRAANIFSPVSDQETAAIKEYVARNKDKAAAKAAAAPKITDYLCDECKAHFERVQAYLTEAGVAFTLDPRLVRGLDYYTKTAFEIKYAPLGAQSAVAGGGRYDGLIEEIGGKPTPAVGFATGLERVLLALEKQNLLPAANETTDVFVVALGDAAQAPAFKLLRDCRRAGLTANMDYAGRSMKAQMKQANKHHARYALILGEDEVQNGTVQLKNMEKSEQKSVKIEDVMSELVK